MMGARQKRLHIGGLFDEVTETELSNRFQKYGEVKNIDIIVRRDELGKFQILHCKASLVSFSICYRIAVITKYARHVWRDF